MADMMTVEDIAERWQMGSEWVRHLCENGTLPAEKSADGWLVAEKDVRTYEAEQYERRGRYSEDEANDPPQPIGPS